MILPIVTMLATLSLASSLSWHACNRIAKAEADSLRYLTRALEWQGNSVGETERANVWRALAVAREAQIGHLDAELRARERIGEPLRTLISERREQLVERANCGCVRKDCATHGSWGVCPGPELDRAIQVYPTPQD